MRRDLTDPRAGHARCSPSQPRQETISLFLSAERDFCHVPLQRVRAEVDVHGNPHVLESICPRCKQPTSRVTENSLNTDYAVQWLKEPNEAFGGTAIASCNAIRSAGLVR